MANVTFRKGLEENLPTDGMAEEGCVYHATDSGNAYIGSSNGSLIPLNRSPYYGTSSTGSSTNSKVVTLDTDVFSLYQGVMITVKFANANTASSPTLNVNSTGAIAVKLYGTTAAGNTPAKSWNAGEAVTFVYDGSYWLLVGGGEDNIGHLNTNNTTSQTPSASESFTSDINLHKVSKTGSYDDLNDTPVYALGESVGGPAKKAISIPFGQVDSTSTSTVFTATVDGITELRDGVCCYIRNGVVTSATGCTLNINGLGAKPMYYTTSSTGRVTSHFSINYTWLFVYNSTRVAGGCWDSYWGYNSEYNLSQNYIYIGRIDVGDYPTSAYSLGAFDVNGKWTPFVTTATTSTGKSLVQSVFPIGAKIYRDSASRSNNTSYNDVYLYTTLSNSDLRYSSVNHNVAIFPNYNFNRVFMPVIVNTQDNTFTLTTQTTSGYNNNFTNERNLNPNNFYIEIGFNSGSTTSYYFTLICENNLYYYDGKNLIDYHLYKTQLVNADLSNKADKVVGATSGNFAGLDSTGNLTDSGYNGNSFLPSSTVIPNDSNLVHKTGAETITGEKTFEANVNLKEGATLNMVYDNQTPDGVYLQAAELNGLKTVSFSGISDDGMVQIKNVYVPTNDTDAANKYYVDEEILGIDEYRVYLACRFGPYGVHQKSLCAFCLTDGGREMTMTSFTQKSGIVPKEVITGLVFPIGCKIYYNDGTYDSLPNTSAMVNRYYTSFNGVDVRYSAITGTSISLGNYPSETQSTVYLHVIVENGYWKPYYKEGATNEIIVDSFHMQSGNYYIYLGKTVRNTGYTIQLEDNNPLYYYDGTSLIDYATHLKAVIEQQSTQDMSSKADKVEEATSGNLAGLDYSGNLTDSGVAADEVATLGTNQLTNYYKKTEIYSKSETDELIRAASDFEYVEVSTLPTASASTKGKFYLYNGHRYVTTEVTSGVFSWIDLGSYDIDLSNYVTNSDFDAELATRPTYERLDSEAQMQSMINNHTWVEGVIYYTVEED